MDDIDFRDLELHREANDAYFGAGDPESRSDPPQTDPATTHTADEASHQSYGALRRCELDDGRPCKPCVIERVRREERFPFHVMHVDLAGVPGQFAASLTEDAAIAVAVDRNERRSRALSELYFVHDVRDPEKHIYP